MIDWKKVVKTIAPKAKASIVSGLSAAMPELIEIADLSTPRRIAHFLAQLAHESAGFRTTVEYASGAAYEGRKDLGNTRPGDGVRFKGRGLIQVTGRDNYRTYGDAIGQDLINVPEEAAKFPAAALTAAHYWRRRALNADADADDIVMVTKKINGGRNGLAQRAAYLKAAKRALAAPQSERDAEPEMQITASDLRAAGSRTIAGADLAQQGLAGSLASIGGATAALSQVQDVASQAQEAVVAVQSGVSALEALRTYWPLIAVVALTGVAAFFVWRAWRGASLVKAARVDDALSGLHVGR
jgi:predicted chitinase